MTHVIEYLWKRFTMLTSFNAENRLNDVQQQSLLFDEILCTNDVCSTLCMKKRTLYKWNRKSILKWQFYHVKFSNKMKIFKNLQI